MNNQERLERWLESRRWPTSYARLNSEFLEKLESETKTPTDNHAFSASSLSALHYLHETQFDQWTAELRAGFNIILYGYGSKYQLLTCFAKHFAVLFSVPVFIVHGWAPALSLKTLLNSLEKMLFSDGDEEDKRKETVESETTMLDSSIDVLMFRILYRLSSATFKKSKIHKSSIPTGISFEPQKVSSAPVCLIVIHNMESEVLRTSLAQRCLAQLAHVLPLIASIDGICTSLIHTRTIWHDATTFIPLTHERTLRAQHATAETKILGSAAGPSLSSIQHVLTALTPAARSVFRLLLSEQLQIHTEIDQSSTIPTTDAVSGTVFKTTTPKETASGISNGVEVERLFVLCVGALVVSHIAGFRALLTEFVDHCIVHMYKDAAGVERLFIPLSHSILVSLFEKLNQNEI
ncbi:hypothetical protein PORY_002338 [Pneumocystis oryctolagi]|uniref:Uncharacterized protein n=1 Tax=Pneumocystis oryctolagi TaxID=42067 RepID=A0ACB7C9Y1_9ASCO|nr:hypothetical protein PORY_002338 [Pneumocystis oryctolagi]